MKGRWLLMRKMKNRKKKFPKYFLVASLGIFLFLGVGYSVLQSSLGLDGTIVNSRNSWDVKFQDISYTQGSVSSTGVGVDNGTGSVEGTVENINLNIPGDFFEFSMNLVNNGTLPAIIDSKEITSLSEDQAKYLKLEIAYDDGYPIEEGDVVKPDSPRKVKVRLEYKKLRDETNYPTEDSQLDLKIKFLSLPS